MGVSVVEPERMGVLNHKPVLAQRAYVLYWMEASARALANHALEYAVERANALDKPLVACYGVADDADYYNLRHCTFLLEGLHELQQHLLHKRQVPLYVLRGDPAQVALQCARQAACEVVTDRGYLRHQRQWRERVAAKLDCRLTQVESEAVVPVELASDRHEFAARTLRPRVWRYIQRFCQAPAEVPQRTGHRESVEVDIGSLKRLLPPEEADAERAVTEALSHLQHIDRSVAPVSQYFRGGTQQALRRLQGFCEGALRHYNDGRNRPESSLTSRLSAYLHFGHISPITVALAAWQAPQVKREDRDAFIEELIVRRELSFNHCWYARDDYDRLRCLPEWALLTGKQHEHDRRDVLYDLETLEHARTADAYWNAAQNEMVYSGRMHGMMRMYWAKKVIEWTTSWQQACEWLIHLNDKYEVDGWDPNSYVGVLWCFGLHDRAHMERPIFGKLRWMSRDGLERKFHMPAYVALVAVLQRGGSMEEAQRAAEQVVSQKAVKRARRK